MMEGGKMMASQKSVSYVVYPCTPVGFNRLLFRNRLVPLFSTKSNRGRATYLEPMKKKLSC